MWLTPEQSAICEELAKLFERFESVSAGAPPDDPPLDFEGIYPVARPKG